MQPQRRRLADLQLRQSDPADGARGPEHDGRAGRRQGRQQDASPSSITFIVDLTPPDITINEPVNKDRYLLHNGPEPDLQLHRPAGRRPASASGFAPSGALTTSSAPGCTATPINDEDLGPHFFEVTATDRAGNTSTKTVAYTIDPPDYGDLIDEDNPLAYYRLDEALGSSEMRDSSGNTTTASTRTGSPCAVTAPPPASAARTRRGPASSPTRPRTRPPSSRS